MLSNLPPMLADQDFETRHSDMLASARAGVTVDPRMLALVERFRQSLDHQAEQIQQEIADDVFREGSQWTDAILGSPVDVSFTAAAFRKFTEVPPWEKEIDKLAAKRPVAATVDVSDQTGSILMIEQLAQILPIGTVFNIEDVRSSDKSDLRDFIVTMTAEIGHRCIRIYPQLHMPRTVLALPKRGAAIILRPDLHGVAIPDDLRYGSSLSGLIS